MASSPKIIVFDDDPTGSQTVRGCPLLLDFSTASLLVGLADPSPLLFLLTNSRALEPEQVRQQLKALCQRLPLLAQLGDLGWWCPAAINPARAHAAELEVIRSEWVRLPPICWCQRFTRGRTTAQACTCCGEPLHHSPSPAIGALAIPAAICPYGLSTKQLERSQLIPWRG